MLEKARQERDSHIRSVSTWEEFVDALDGNMVLAPWCECIACEEEVKKRTAPDAMEKKPTKPAADKPKGRGKVHAKSVPRAQRERPARETAPAGRRPTPKGRKSR